MSSPRRFRPVASLLFARAPTAALLNAQIVHALGRTPGEGEIARETGASEEVRFVRSTIGMEPFTALGCCRPFICWPITPEWFPGILYELARAGLARGGGALLRSQGRPDDRCPGLRLAGPTPAR